MQNNETFSLDRRNFVALTGIGGLVGLAGCGSREPEETGPTWSRLDRAGDNIEIDMNQETRRNQYATDGSALVTYEVSGDKQVDDAHTWSVEADIGMSGAGRYDKIGQILEAPGGREAVNEDLTGLVNALCDVSVNYLEDVVTGRRPQDNQVNQFGLYLGEEENRSGYEFGEQELETILESGHPTDAMREAYLSQLGRVGAE